MKKILSIILTIFIVCVSIPINSVMALESYTYNGLKYNIREGAIHITGYDASSLDPELVIPSKIDNIPVISIGGYAFEKCKIITKVDIADTITTINSGAFKDCTNLSEVDLPENLVTLQENLFNGCTSLTEITIPKNIEYIQSDVFYGCTSLTTVNYNFVCLKQCYSSMFSNCPNIVNLNVGENVEVIPGVLFTTLTNLNKIYVDANNNYYTCEDNIIYDKYKTSIVYYSANKTNASFAVPNNISFIENYAFVNAKNLKAISIGRSVKKIGNSAFLNCTSLTTLEFNATDCESAGTYTYPAFKGCTSLENFYIGEYVRIIPSFIMKDNTKISKIDLPDRLTKIGEYAFYGCTKPSKVTIGEKVTYIGDYAFKNCRGIEELYFNAIECNTIGSYDKPAFSSVGDWTTDTNVVIGDKVTILPDYAFRNCEGMKTLTIGESVKELGVNVFIGTPDLHTVNFNAISCADDEFSKYMFDSEDVIVNLNFGPKVERIPGNMFKYINIKEVVIPENVKQVGVSAFRHCQFLKTIVFNATDCDFVGSAGSDVAFYGCGRVETFKIGLNVKKIDNSVSSSLNGLTDVYYEGSLEDRNNKLIINEYNTEIINAKWHYKVCVNHEYDNACDNTCNICDGERTITHNYSSVCDTTCDICFENRIANYSHTYSSDCDNSCNHCGEIREITHNYSSDCDTICNLCSQIRTSNIAHTYTKACDSNCALCGLERGYFHRYASEYFYDETHCWNKCMYCDYVINKNLHIYSNDCDATCNNCSHIRKVGEHFYDNDCDTDCNKCDYVRFVEPHTFTSDCDEICNKCDYIRIVSVEHTFESSCAESCIKCGTYRVPAHQYRLATCTEPKTCLLCGDSKGDPLEHDMQSATCTLQSKCSRCSYTEGIALGHDMQPATCMSPSICTRCQYTEGTKLEHNYLNFISNKDASCDSFGTKTAKCEYGCDSEKTIIDRNSKLDHIYDKGYITKNPSCFEEGIKLYKCTVCESSKTEKITKIDHKFETKVKKATLNANGKNWDECTVCGTKMNEKTIYSAKTVKIATTKYTFNGKTQKPTIIVKDSKGKTISSSYYTLSGDKSGKAIDKYKVKVTFKGKYSGSKTLSYEIVKPTVNKSSISKLTAAKKSLKVSIKKVSSVTGYEIEYSTSKKFKSSKKKTTTKTTYTIKSLKSNKTYYVRVRSYKIVGGKKFYSAWSSYKYKKTK